MRIIKIKDIFMEGLQQRLTKNPFYHQKKYLRFRELEQVAKNCKKIERIKDKADRKKGF
ncbi:MAG: hypothetical protein Q4A90_08800 [Streptococcus sp.]|nr:hypothetical protein [Streptococcus sp.]